MNRWLRIAICTAYAVFLLYAPYWYYRFTRKEFRGFREVTPNVLYRSGQFTPNGLAQLVHQYGFRTIITLRAPDRPDMAWEEEFCSTNGIEFVRLPAREWWAKDGPAPADAIVKKFFKVVKDPERYPRPILLHCFAGEHRTGAFIALYRIECEGWSNEDALKEMHDCGYVNLDKEWDVRSYVYCFQPSWRATSESHASRSTDSVTPIQRIMP